MQTYKQTDIHTHTQFTYTNAHTYVQMYVHEDTGLLRYICMYIPPTVHRILYYQDELIAVVKVANVGVDPTFIIQPSAELARTVCPNCMSSTEGELRVNLGQLAQELGMKDKNITIWMSWELPRSWEAKCGGGGLTLCVTEPI